MPLSRVVGVLCMSSYLVFGDDGDGTLSVAEAFNPTKGNVIGYIDVLDEMHIEFDVTIHSFPSGWANILHCSGSDFPRIPGIWIHPDSASSMGFHAKFSNDDNQNYGADTGGALVAGELYHFELDITQGTHRVTINDVVVVDAQCANHDTYEDVVCYGSNPWYPAADVTIENLYIGGPEFHCAEHGCDAHLVCDEDSGQCLRNCALFQIDEFLLDCSAEWDSNEDTVEAMATSIGENSVGIASNADAIDTNAADISSNAADIGDLSTEMSSLTTDISEMQSSIDAIERVLFQLGFDPDAASMTGYGSNGESRSDAGARTFDDVVPMIVGAAAGAAVIAGVVALVVAMRRRSAVKVGGVTKNGAFHVPSASVVSVGGIEVTANTEQETETKAVTAE